MEVIFVKLFKQAQWQAKKANKKDPHSTTVTEEYNTLLLEKLKAKDLSKEEYDEAKKIIFHSPYKYQKIETLKGGDNIDKN